MVPVPKTTVPPLTVSTPLAADSDPLSVVNVVPVLMMVSGKVEVIDPWLSTAAVMVRVPPPQAATLLRVPVLVSVPPLTVRPALAPEVPSAISMVPALVRSLVTVSSAGFA